MRKFGLDFTNITCYILSPFVSKNYFLQTISVKLIFMFYMSIMVICSLDTMKKSSKKKETETEKEINIKPS